MFKSAAGLAFAVLLLLGGFSESHAQCDPRDRDCAKASKAREPVRHHDFARPSAAPGGSHAPSPGSAAELPRAWREPGAWRLRRDGSRKSGGRWARRHRRRPHRRSNPHRTGGRIARNRGRIGRRRYATAACSRLSARARHSAFRLGRLRIGGTELEAHACEPRQGHDGLQIFRGFFPAQRGVVRTGKGPDDHRLAA